MLKMDLIMIYFLWLQAFISIIIDIIKFDALNFIFCLKYLSRLGDKAMQRGTARSGKWNNKQFCDRNMKQNAWTNINWNWSHTEKNCITCRKKKKRVKSFSQHCNKLQLQSVGKKRVSCAFFSSRLLPSVQRSFFWSELSAAQLRRRRGELRFQQSRLTFSQIVFGMERKLTKRDCRT